MLLKFLKATSGGYEEGAVANIPDGEALAYLCANVAEVAPEPLPQAVMKRKRGRPRKSLTAEQKDSA